MLNQKVLPFDIQLFAEGGGDGGNGGEGASGVQAADAGQHRSGEKGNPLANVVYGKQESTAAAPAAGESTNREQEPSEDRKSKFNELIRGEYKDLYDANVQGIIRERLRSTEEKVGKYDAMATMREMLGKRYGVDPNDAAALTKAIEDDNSFYEDEASELGMSVQQLREMRKYERENAALHAQIEATAAEEKTRQLYDAWIQEAEEAKKLYPGLDLQAELANPVFQTLISQRVPIQTAYEVVHKDEIITAAMEETARQIEQKLANNIAAGGSRPREGALGGQGAVTVKDDVRKFTKADREEIYKRSLRGERIVL